MDTTQTPEVAKLTGLPRVELTEAQLVNISDVTRIYGWLLPNGRWVSGEVFADTINREIAASNDEDTCAFRLVQVLRMNHGFQFLHDMWADMSHRRCEWR